MAIVAQVGLYVDSPRPDEHCLARRPRAHWHRGNRRRRQASPGLSRAQEFVQHRREPDQGIGDRAKFLEPQRVGQAIGEGRVSGPDPVYGLTPSHDRAQKLGSLVRRVRSILSRSLLYQDVGDPMNGLARHPGLTADLRHGHRP